MNKELYNMALILAFEAGRWHGQVDLEEHYDIEQYGQSIAEVFHTKKTCRPIKKESIGKTVEINLRSDKWRKGVIKSSNAYLQKAKNLFDEF